MGAIVCSFTSTDELKGKNRTYENIKALVLRVGCFSTFDVNGRKDGQIFTALCRDPELEVVEMPYPWVGIRRKKKSC